MPQIQIFKPGTVTSMEGASLSFSDADLQGIAARYDPQLHEAPFIIGHPAHDAPAYGWVKALSFADGVLAADAQQLDEGFTDLHRRGRFKKVSARFYTPTSANNPTPGEYYLRDVGFLGAMPPAVKGLRTASFADDVELVTAEISFGDLPAYAGNSIAGLFRRMRDWLIAKEGLEQADQVLPSWEVDALREISQRAGDSPDSTNRLAFGDEGRPDLLDASSTTQAGKEPATTMTKTTEQLQADLDAANAQLTAMKAADAARQAEARHRDNASFVDQAVADARWPGGAKDVLVATLDALATPAADSGCVSFGDGAAAQPLHQALREQIKALPPLVSFGETARKTKGGAEGATDRQVADRAAAHRQRMADKGQNITLGQAIDAVNAGTDKE